MAPHARQLRALDSDLNASPTNDAKPKKGKADINLTDRRIGTLESSVFYSLTMSGGTGEIKLRFN